MTDIPSVKCGCQNCHFVKDPGFKERSVCQRFPPVPVPSKSYDGQTIMESRVLEITFVQPTVFPDGFCGEWGLIV